MWVNITEWCNWTRAKMGSKNSWGIWAPGVYKVGRYPCMDTSGFSQIFHASLHDTDHCLLVSVPNGFSNLLVTKASNTLNGFGNFLAKTNQLFIVEFVRGIFRQNLKTHGVGLFCFCFLKCQFSLGVSGLLNHDHRISETSTIPKTPKEVSVSKFIPSMYMYNKDS